MPVLYGEINQALSNRGRADVCVMAKVEQSAVNSDDTMSYAREGRGENVMRKKGSFLYHKYVFYTKRALLCYSSCPWLEQFMFMVYVHSNIGAIA